MLSCAKGEAAAASITAIARAPNPNVSSVQWWRPKNKPILGSDRIAPATASQNSTLVTEYSVSCLLKVHIATMAMMAAV